MLKTVPKRFFQEPDRFKHLAGNSHQCILYKTLNMNSIQANYYVSKHVITLVLKGEKNIQVIDGGVKRIRPGQFAYIPKDLYLIQDITPNEGAFESWLFFFDDEMVQQCLTNLKPSRTGSPYVSNHTQRESVICFDYSSNLQTYIKSLHALLDNMSNMPPQFVELKIQELLHLLSMEEKGSSLINQLSALQAKPRRSITAFMEDHFTKPLKVEDYAYLTGRSLSSFLRDFKKHYQTTPKKWLKDKRLTYAKDLFMSQKQSVTEVAYEVGYENISHFIRGFKEKYSLSPKQFVLKHRTESL